MVFSSLTFLLLFLPCFLIIYTYTQGLLQNLFLLAASLLFYGWSDPAYVLLILFEALLAYLAGLWMGKTARKKAVLIAAAAIIIALFVYFKYTTFLVESLDALFSLDLIIPDIILPLGISFFSFQILSYLFDLYQQKAAVQKNLLDFLVYVTMFPQLIAGPIVRYQSIAPKLSFHPSSWKEKGQGVEKFCIGLAKKCLLANALYPIAQSYAALSPSTLGLWAAILSNMLYIYFDFSGYSDMAIGLGKMLGFSFPENFNYPLSARNLREFWRRWHMSLTSWFKDYVYIPLGGNRKGRARTIFNLLLVWILTGIWHGAGWNFLFWGLGFWFFLVLERFVFDHWNRHKILGWIVSVLITLLLFWLFSAPSLSIFLQDVKIAFGLQGVLVNHNAIALWLENCCLLLIAITASTCWPYKLFMKTAGSSYIVRFTGSLVLLLLCIASLVSGSFNPFLYFRF